MALKERTQILSVAVTELKDSQHVGHDQSPLGVVQVALLEGRDGTDPGGAPARRKDDLRQRHCFRPVQRRHDSHRWLQHEEDHQGQRHHQAVGHRRPAQIQVSSILGRFLRLDL